MSTQDMEMLKDPLLRFFERAYSTLLSHWYLYILTNSIKIKDKRKHEFDFDLDDLGISKNVFYESLLLFGYSVELVLKFMFLYKTNDLNKTLDWDHRLSALLSEMTRLYKNKSIMRFKKMIGEYEEFVVWLGRYPYSKKPRATKVDDLLLMQDKRKELWISLLDTFESSLSKKEDRDNFKILKNHFLPPKYHDTKTNLEFFERIQSVAVERIVAVAKNYS